ncbi:MAG: hypothetical protein J6N32_10745, partial [Clostridia bacterium]|nr:hypothetical protein [Clostridia bacterium]
IITTMLYSNKSIKNYKKKLSRSLTFQELDVEYEYPSRFLKSSGGKPMKLPILPPPHILTQN